MKMVSRVVALSELSGVVGITHGGIEIENAVKGSAGTNPPIYRLTCRLSIVAVVVGAFIGRQGCTEHPDSVLVSTCNDLLQTHDEVLGSNQLVRKWQVFHDFAIRQAGLHVRPADVVDTLKHDKVHYAGLREHVSIKAGEGAYAGTVVQNAISADSLIRNGKNRTTCNFCKAACQE